MLAIIEVFPEQAEVIRWAQRSESESPQNYIDLAVALRSTKDDGDALSANDCIVVDQTMTCHTTGVTFVVLVDKYGVLPPDPTGSIPSWLGIKVQW